MARIFLINPRQFRVAAILAAVMTVVVWQPMISEAAKNVNREQYATIRRHMNASASPCEDFFEYACGNWRNAHDSDKYNDVMTLIDYKANQAFARLLKTIRKTHHKHHQNKFVRNVLDYHRSCMGVTEFEPFESLFWLKKIEGLKWPPMNSRRERRSGRRNFSFDWLHTLAALSKYGMNGVFLELMVLRDDQDGRRSVIDLDKPVMNGGFRPFNAKESELMTHYLKLSNDDIDDDDIITMWSEVWKFEQKLLTLNDIEDEVGVQQVRVTDLDMPQIDQYLHIVMNRTRLPDDFEVKIQNLPYMRALFELLDTYNADFICRYLMLRFLYHLHLETPNTFQKIDCISHTRSALPMAMHWLYEQQNEDLAAETENVKRLFQHLMMHLRQAIEANSNDFEENVQKFLLDKVAALQIKVGNLPRPDTMEILEEFYKPLNIHRSDFYLNHLRVLHFNRRVTLQRVDDPLPETIDEFYHLEDFLTGASSSPYYVVQANVVIVPLTLLQPPIYHPAMADIYKYSLLGFLLAHEISHGFDESSMDYDSKGVMRSFMDVMRANEVFDANLDCLREKNPNVIDEKIADVSGLRWAFEAYFRDRWDAAAAAVPFSQESPERLFFLNFAQFFCGLNDPETSDFTEHGSDSQRVFDSLANLEAFGKAYHCSANSPLNPSRKCQLWR